MQFQGERQGFGGGGVIAGLMLQQAEVGKRAGLAELIGVGSVQFECQGEILGGRGVVARQVLGVAQDGQGVGFAAGIALFTVQLDRARQAGDRGREVGTQ